MKMTLLRATVVSLVMPFCSITTAGIIDTNNDSFIDESTGLEWLDFGVNNDLSYNFVSTNLGEGEVFSGWRLPTEREVFELFDNAFVKIDLSQVISHEQALPSGPNYNVGDNLFYLANTSSSVYDSVFSAMSFNYHYNWGSSSIGMFESQGSLSQLSFSTDPYYGLKWVSLAYDTHNDDLVAATGAC